jgi:hypothetical protein
VTAGDVVECKAMAGKQANQWSSWIGKLHLREGALRLSLCASRRVAAGSSGAATVVLFRGDDAALAGGLLGRDVGAARLGAGG